MTSICTTVDLHMKAMSLGGVANFDLHMKAMPLGGVANFLSPHPMLIATAFLSRGLTG